MDKSQPVADITVGCDPEFFMVNKERKLISSIGKFGGTKTHPAPLGNNCYIQEDNVAVEFNIPPSDTVDKFLEHISYSLRMIESRANAMGLFSSIVPAAHFDKDQLNHPKATVFGCDPDWNAWTKDKNNPPDCEDKSLRSAGGHVHVGCIGWMNDHPHLRPFDVARAMDLFLGVPSVVLDRDQARRKLYGKAGAFRPKRYGMEYRTLSNFWIKTPQLQRWVFEKVHDAIEFLSMGNRLEDKDGVEIQKCINEGSIDMMHKILDTYGLEAARI